MMALGKRQLETLNEFANMLKAQPNIIQLQVKIGNMRSYTRELGRGIAISIVPFECYEDGEQRMRGSWIADCQFDWTAVEKAQEIARHLVKLGCPKDRIKIRRA